METKFTKGEWILLANSANQKIFVVNERHCLLAHCYAHVRDTGNQPLTIEQAEANAKLIAAAPDLFAALDLAIRKLKAIGEGDSIAVKTGLIAIQKATELN